ncbi:OmpA family protein [Hymenobacter perfusus]|uniref:OmpA family protein n=1 Tax=Hymenobacter perfusus TaxID=1236770 RepID=A0A3R9N2C4_9BACT|nr:PA14 domain-containing protein [Hymenobacter perfusus]RSK46496.1 hypothetical protein EI293_04855 [Hymenobacter perfusus]
MLPARYFRNMAFGWLLLFSFSSAAQSRPSGTGLRGQYYEGQNFEKLALTRVDPGIDFNWTIGPTGDHFVSPGPGVPGEWFSARWKGHLYAPVTGVYTFRMTMDDGMRVWVGGQRILNSWQNQAVSSYTAQIALTAGRYYPIRVEYYQAGQDSRAALAWQLPTTTEPEPIPAAYLYASLPTTAVPVPVAASKPAAQPVRPQPAAPRPSVTMTPLEPAVVVGRRPVAAAPRAARVVRRPQATPLPPKVTPPDTVPLPDLSALSKGAAVTLPNLYFTQSTAALLPSSRPTLNELARRLREQPAMRLEIAGHTDNVGEAALNLRLSEQRARVVRQYLVQQGIDSVRLAARGYGGTRPVADNRDPQQRPRNRRVEVVVQ